MTSIGGVQEVDPTTGYGFRRVVVGIDGSRESYEAARQALRLVDDDAPADLVTAFVPFVPLMGMTSEVAPTYLDEERLRDGAEKTIDRALAAVDGRARGYARPGVPWDALIDAAGGAAGGLLAVASHGTGRFAGIVFGSVATEIVHKSPVSVLVARDAGCEFPSNIVVGVDGSASSLAAFEVARGLASRFDATLLPVVARGGKDVNAARIAAIIGPRFDAMDDPPARALAAAASDADLLVVGGRGLHGLRALGSVSERVAHAAPCSVLIVRNVGPA